MAKIQRLVFVALLGLVTMAFSCKDPYGNAAKLYQDVSVTIGQASSTVDQFRKDGTISVDEDRTIQGYLVSLNNINGTYGSCVKAVHASATKSGGFTACAQTLDNAMSDPQMLASLHITSAKGQQEVSAVTHGIITLVTTTITALGGK